MSTGVSREGRAAPAVRFGPVVGRPSPGRSRYVRPTGTTTGPPLVETALRVGADRGRFRNRRFASLSDLC